MIDYLSTFNQNIGIFVQILLHGQKVDQLGHFYTAIRYLGKFLFVNEDRNESWFRAIKPLPGSFIKDGICGYCITPFHFQRVETNP